MSTYHPNVSPPTLVGQVQPEERTPKRPRHPLWLGLLLPLVLMSGCYNPESPSVTASEHTRDGVKLTVRGLQVRKMGGSGPEFYYPSRPIQLSLQEPESGAVSSCTVNIRQPNSSPARRESDSHVVATQCEGPMAGAADQTTDAQPAPTIRFSCQPLSESARDFSCHLSGLRSATAYSVQVSTEIDNWNHRDNKADVDSVRGSTDFQTLPLPAPSLVIDTSGQLRPIRIASQGSGVEIGSAIALKQPQESWSPAQVQTDQYSSVAIEGYEHVPRFDDLIVGDYNADGLEDLLAVSAESPPVILQAQKGSAAYLRRDLQLDRPLGQQYAQRVAQVHIDGVTYLAIAGGPSPAVSVYQLSHRLEQGRSHYSARTLGQLDHGQDQTQAPEGSAILSVALAPRHTQPVQTEQSDQSGSASKLADALLVVIGHKAPDHSVGYTLCPLQPDLKHLGQCQRLSAEPALNAANQADASPQARPPAWINARTLLRDFNGDGYTDVLQVRQGQLQLGSASGTFSERHDPTTQAPARVFQDSAPTEPTVGVAYTDAQALDLDRDGDIDLLVQSPTQGTYAYYNRGDGVFSSQPSPAISAIATTESATESATQAGPSSPHTTTTLPRYLKVRQIGHTTTVVLMDEQTPQRWSSHAQTSGNATQSALGELERHLHLHAEQVPEYLQQDYRTLKAQYASAQTSAPDALRRARQIAIRLYNDPVIELAARQAQQYPQCTDLSAKSFEDVHDCAKQVFAHSKDPLGLSQIPIGQDSAEPQVIQTRQIQDGSGPQRIQDGEQASPYEVVYDNQTSKGLKPTPAFSWKDYAYGQHVMDQAHKLVEDRVAHSVDQATLQRCARTDADYGQIELFYACVQIIQAYESAAQVSVHDSGTQAQNVAKATEGQSCWPTEANPAWPRNIAGILGQGSVNSAGHCVAKEATATDPAAVTQRYYTRRQPRAQVLSLDHGRQLMVYTRPQGGVQVAVGDTQNGTTQCRTIGTESDKDHIAACHWIWADPQLSWSAPYSANLSDQQARLLTQLPEGAVNLNPTPTQQDPVYACLAEGEGTRPLSGQLIQSEDGWVCKTPKDSGTQLSNGMQTATQFRVLISHQIREAAQNPRRQLEAGGGDGYKRVIFDESTHPALVNFTSWLRSLTGDKQTEGEGRIYLNESSQQWAVGVKNWPDQIVLDVNSGTPVIRMRNQDHQQDLPWLVSSVGLTGADTETGLFTGLTNKVAGTLNAGTQLAAAYDVISPSHKRMRLWLDRDGELWRSSVKVRSLGTQIEVPRLMHLTDTVGMNLQDHTEAEHRLVYRLGQCDSERGQCTWYLDAAAMSYPQQEMFFVRDEGFQLKGLVAAGCLGASSDQPNDTHWLRFNEQDQTLAWSRSSASSGFYLQEGVRWESALRTPKAECQYVRHQTSMPFQERIVYGHSSSASMARTTDPHRVFYLTPANTALQPYAEGGTRSALNLAEKWWTSAVDWLSNTVRTIASGTSHYTKDRQELLAFYKTHASLYQNISQAVQSLTGSAFIEAHTLNLQENNQQQAWYVMNGEPINANGSGTENNQEAIYGQSQFARVPFVTLSSIDMFISNVKLAMQTPENQALCKECGFAPDWPFQISEEELRKQAIDSYKAYGYIDWASIFAPEILSSDMVVRAAIELQNKKEQAQALKEGFNKDEQCSFYRALMKSPFNMAVTPVNVNVENGVCSFDIDWMLLGALIESLELSLEEKAQNYGVIDTRSGGRSLMNGTSDEESSNELNESAGAIREGVLRASEYSLSLPVCPTSLYDTGWQRMGSYQDSRYIEVLNNLDPNDRARFKKLSRCEQAALVLNRISFRPEEFMWVFDHMNGLGEVEGGTENPNGVPGALRSLGLQFENEPFGYRTWNLRDLLESIDAAYVEEWEFLAPKIRVEENLIRDMENSINSERVNYNSRVQTLDQQQTQMANVMRRNIQVRTQLVNALYVETRSFFHYYSRHFDRIVGYFPELESLHFDEIEYNGNPRAYALTFVHRLFTGHSNFVAQMLRESNRRGYRYDRLSDEDLSVPEIPRTIVDYISRISRTYRRLVSVNSTIREAGRQINSIQSNRQVLRVTRDNEINNINHDIQDSRQWISIRTAEIRNQRRDHVRLILGLISGLLPDIEVSVRHAVGVGFVIHFRDAEAGALREYRLNSDYTLRLISPAVVGQGGNRIQPSQSVSRLVRQQQIINTSGLSGERTSVGLISMNPSASEVRNRQQTVIVPSREILLPAQAGVTSSAGANGTNDVSVVCNSSSLVLSRDVGPGYQVSNINQQSTMQINTAVQHTIGYYNNQQPLTEDQELSALLFGSIYQLNGFGDPQNPPNFGGGTGGGNSRGFGGCGPR